MFLPFRGISLIQLSDLVMIVVKFRCLNFVLDLIPPKLI